MFIVEVVAFLVCHRAARCILLFITWPLDASHQSWQLFGGGGEDIISNDDHHESESQSQHSTSITVCFLPAMVGVSECAAAQSCYCIQAKSDCMYSNVANLQLHA